MKTKILIPFGPYCYEFYITGTSLITRIERSCDSGFSRDVDYSLVPLSVKEVLHDKLQAIPQISVE